MKISIRQSLAFTLIAALSLQAYIERKRVTLLRAFNQAEWAKYESLESRAHSLRQRTAVCKMVVKDWPYPSEDYPAAQDRFRELPMTEQQPNVQ
jgi:hypothetical protein